jgi:hypothetical protein
MIVISEIVLFSNGMVAVFDKKGRQISKYQGSLPDVRKRLTPDDLQKDVIFSFCQWGVNIPDHPELKDQKIAITISREQFFSPAWVSESEYDQGYRDGLTSCAYWENNRQLVGVKKIPLSQAIEKRKESPYYKKEDAS